MPDPNKIHVPSDAARAAAAPAQSSDGMFAHLRVSVVAVLTTAILLCGVYPVIVWGISQLFFNHKANGSLVYDKANHVIGSELLGQNFAARAYFHPRPSLNSYDPTNTGGTNLGPTSKKLINGATQPTTAPVPQSGQPPTPRPASAAFTGVKLNVLIYADENAIPFALYRRHLDASGQEIGIPIAAAEFKTGKGDWDQVKLINAFNDDSDPLMIKPSQPIPADAVTWSASGLDPHISPANAKLQIIRVAEERKVNPRLVEKLVQENTDGPDLGFLGDAGVNVVRLNLALDKAYPPPATQSRTAP